MKISIIYNIDLDNTELIRKWCVKKLQIEKRETNSDFKDIEEQDIPFDLYSKIRKLIFEDISDLIDKPLHTNIETELEILLEK